MSSPNSTVHKVADEIDKHRVVLKILFFLIPFGIILIMSLTSGKSYTNSMADFTIYKRYFAIGLFSIFLIIAIVIGINEYRKYKETNKNTDLAYVKISIIVSVFLSVFILFNVIILNRLNKSSVQTRTKVEAFNRSLSGVRTIFDIFRGR